MKDDIRTLCYHCKQIYENAGYQVIGPLPNQTTKQPCETCRRMGYDYLIEEKKVTD